MRSSQRIVNGRPYYLRACCEASLKRLRLNRIDLYQRRAWEDVVSYCEREEIAFIPWNPLAAGNIAAHGALEPGATPYQIALAWLLARSRVMLMMPGTSRVAHLEENMTAASIVLSPEDLATLDAAQTG